MEGLAEIAGDREKKKFVLLPRRGMQLLSLLHSGIDRAGFSVLLCGLHCFQWE